MLTLKGAKLDVKADYGFTALAWATKQGHDKIVISLVEKGANLDTQDLLEERRGIKVDTSPGFSATTASLTCVSTSRRHQSLSKELVYLSYLSDFDGLTDWLMNPSFSVVTVANTTQASILVA